MEPLRLSDASLARLCLGAACVREAFTIGERAIDRHLNVLTNPNHVVGSK